MGIPRGYMLVLCSYNQLLTIFMKFYTISIFLYFSKPFILVNYLGTLSCFYT